MGDFSSACRGALGRPMLEVLTNLRTPSATWASTLTKHLPPMPLPVGALCCRRSPNLHRHNRLSFQAAFWPCDLQPRTKEQKTSYRTEHRVSARTGQNTHASIAPRSPEHYRSTRSVASFSPGASSRPADCWPARMARAHLPPAHREGSQRNLHDARNPAGRRSKSARRV